MGVFTLRLSHLGPISTVTKSRIKDRPPGWYPDKVCSNGAFVKGSQGISATFSGIFVHPSAPQTRRWPGLARRHEGDQGILVTGRYEGRSPLKRPLFRTSAHVSHTRMTQPGRFSCSVVALRGQRAQTPRLFLTDWR